MQNEERRNRGRERRRQYSAPLLSSAFCVLHSAFIRIGAVIRRVTLSKTVPALEGGRWLIVSPFTREHFQRGTETPPGMSKDPSLVVYDSIGGGVGQTIGFIEGREAAQPFDG